MSREKLETYKALVLSTGHMTYQDSLVLRELAGKDSMIMASEYGFFVKLYARDAHSGSGDDPNHRDGLSAHFHKIIAYALDKGYRLVEFDQDAEMYDLFPRFDW